jgi:glycine hydroxymethyltransferase
MTTTLQETSTYILNLTFYLFSISGAPAMTSRGLLEKDFEQIGEFLHQAVSICLKIQKEHGKLLKDFNKGLVNNPEIENLKAAVEKFSSSFEMPGFKVSEMKYKD